MTLHLRRIVRNRIAMLHFEYFANEQKTWCCLNKQKIPKPNAAKNARRSKQTYLLASKIEHNACLAKIGCAIALRLTYDFTENSAILYSYLLQAFVDQGDRPNKNKISSYRRGWPSMSRYKMSRTLRSPYR